MIPSTANLSNDSKALIDLIVSSTATIEALYKDNGQPLPSLALGAPEDTGSDRGPGKIPSAELIQALQLLQGATTQLLAQLTPPPLYTGDLALGSLDSAALGVVVDARVADAIYKHDPKGLSGVPLQTIAKETNLEPRHLGRILRALACKHVFAEVAPDVFANNRLSAPLRSDTRASCLNVLGHWVFDIMPSAIKLPEVLADVEHAASFSVAHSGAARAFGNVFWDFLQEQPVRGRRFNEAMKEATAWISVADSVAEDVPWAEDFARRAPKGVFVDVGAGPGHQALAVAAKLPQWEFVIQDRPEVLETSAKELWDAQGQQYQHRLVAQDFFKPQIVKGADVYYMKHIIHDWPDKECVTILKHLRDAADPSRTRLLIADAVMQAALPTAACNGSTNGSPFPLLSNLGGGASFSHRFDMIMMTALEAQERTQAEFENNVLTPAGWKLSKIHNVRSHIRLAVLECVPV